MEIYEFRRITQASGEMLQEFYRRLKEKSATCEFHNEETEIRTQIIHNTSDSRLRRKALHEEMNLDALLKYGMILEKSDHHTKVLEEDSRSGTSQQANFINNKNDWRNSRDRNQVNKETERGKIPSRKCRNCGGSFPHEGGKLSCPAAEKKCFLCGKIGHFAKHCLSSPPQRSSNSSQNKEHFKPKPNDNKISQEKKKFVKSPNKVTNSFTIRMTNIRKQ